MKRSTIRGCVLAAMAMLTLASDRADAAFVTYTEVATGSGSLGGVTFANALITISGTGDTNNVTGTAPLFNVPVLATVTVANVGAATFLGNIAVVINQTTGVAGFGSMTNGFFILGNNNPAFGPYDLRSSIGPLSGQATINTGRAFGTTSGNFIITSISTPGSFGAVVTNAVPEPASLSMLGLGLAGVGAALRRRKSS